MFPSNATCGIAGITLIGSHDMPSDRRLFAIARLLTRRHGIGALAMAYMRREDMREAGDRDGIAVWERICWFAEALSPDRPEGSTRH